MRVAGPARQVAVGEIIPRGLLPFSGPLRLPGRRPLRKKKFRFLCCSRDIRDSSQGPELISDYARLEAVSMGLAPTGSPPKRLNPCLPLEPGEPPAGRGATYARWKAQRTL